MCRKVQMGLFCIAFVAVRTSPLVVLDAFDTLGKLLIFATEKLMVISAFVRTWNPAKKQKKIALWLEDLRLHERR